MTVQPQMKKVAKCKVRPARSRAAGKSINRCVAPTGRGDNDRRDQTCWRVGITIDPKLRKPRGSNKPEWPAP